MRTPQRYRPFPRPAPADSRIEAIAEAARRLDELRRNWLNPEGASEAELKKRTLTNLYNARPTWLENVHERLDEAVFMAYGWPVPLADEQVLSNTLELRASASRLATFRTWRRSVRLNRCSITDCYIRYSPTGGAS